LPCRSSSARPPARRNRAAASDTWCPAAPRMVPGSTAASVSYSGPRAGRPSPAAGRIRLLRRDRDQCHHHQRAAGAVRGGERDDGIERRRGICRLRRRRHRGEQCGPPGRCWIHDRVKLLCSEEAFDGCSDQWQTVITDGCVAVVLETSAARRLALEQGPARWIRAAPSARGAVKRLDRWITSSMVLG